MNINTNDLNFKGRYLLYGKQEHANRAATLIKSAKKDNVEFLPITCGENKIVVVATQKDAEVLRNKKETECFMTDVKNLYNDKKNFLKNLFKYIFSSASDALIIQGDALAKFGLLSNKINFDTGASLSQYKSAEKFVDGTCKKYTLKGRLCEIIRPDGAIETIAPNGTKTIAYKNGLIEVIPVNSSKKETSSLNVATKPVQREVFVVSQPVENKNEAIDVSEISEKPQAKEENSPLEIYDKKGRLKKQILDQNLEANYFYNGNTNEVLFIHYSNGQIETDNGVVDWDNETIELPYRDGIKQILDKNGKIRAFVFPDGTKKIYDENENIVEKILPDKTRELFSPRGRMYLRILPDGTKEYTKSIRPSVFVG